MAREIERRLSALRHGCTPLFRVDIASVPRKQPSMTFVPIVHMREHCVARHGAILHHATDHIMVAPMQPHQPISRRGFGRRAAAAALVPAAVAAPSPQGRGQLSPLPPADQSEVDAKFANVIRRYGDRLSEEQRNRVRTVLARHQRMLIRIREFPLDNGDAPATGLRLYPNDTTRR